MIPAIKGDRTSRPWVELWGDGLDGIDISECTLTLPLRDMSDIDHIQWFDLGGKFLLSPYVLWAKLFIIVLAGRPFPLVFGVELAGLFKDPTISVGTIDGLVRGAMNLARPIEYFVQTGWAIFVSFEWLLPMSGSRAAESGVDRCVA